VVTLVGDRNVETNVDNNLAGVAEAFQYTAGAGGAATKLSLYVDSASTASKIVVGIYTNTGSNHPGTLLRQATITAPVKGAWNTVNLTTTTITAGTVYWIAVLGPSGAGTVQFRDVGSGGRCE